MTNAELMSYMERAQQYEAAIHTQKLLMAEHRTLHEMNKPDKPKLHLPQSPQKPIPKEPIRADGNTIGALWCTGFVALLGGACFLFITIYILLFARSGYAEETLPIYLPGMLLLTAPFFWVYKKGYRPIKEQNESQLEQYNYQMRLYEKQLQQYQISKQRAEDEHVREMREYELRLANYRTDVNAMMAKHEMTLESLTNVLEQHYALGILYPKYRNFVSVSAINEYLSSGRCDRLEGPDGAYNLYEMELRQNIVIGQLSAVLNNIEQIRNNQYTLYQELTHANNLVSDIITEIRELNSTAKLNAYFAALNAQIAAAPQYIHGHIY